MRHYSNNREINSLVKELTGNGWIFKTGRKHASLISPAGRRIIVPCTPSDCRAFDNFKRDIRDSCKR
jgi:hypothetical protein